MLKKRVTLLIILLILCISVNASKIEINSSKTQNKIFPGSEVNYIVNVTNKQLRDEIIKISPDPFSVYPFSDFIDSIKINPSQLNIASDKTGVFQVNIKYSKSIKSEKAYTTNIILKSLINPELREVYPLTSFIINSGEIITTNVKINEIIFPGKETNLDITFKNNLNENFYNLSLYISIGQFSEEYKLSINAKEEIKKTFPIKINTETPPGEYDLILNIYSSESLKGNNEVKIKVESNKELEEKITRTNTFLKNKIVITKINKGNILINKIIKYPIGSFEKLFTDTSLKADFIKEENQNYFLWTLNINPGEEINIIIETDYSSFFFTIFGFILLCGLIYYVNNRALKITKQITAIKDKNKKVSFKVNLGIQNYTSKPIHNLKVVDLLPHLIKHYGDFGTLEPKNIQQGSKGLRFVWEINKLDSGEERILTYKIEPQLNLFGNIRLPPASLQILDKKNKLIIRRSNTAIFKLNKEKF